MERRKFEDSFKQAFDEAEVNTSDNVWTGIELELEKAEGDKTKRRLLFYKLLAAASVTFALCVAGIGYYIIDSKTTALNEQLAADATIQQPADASIRITDEISSSATSGQPEPSDEISTREEVRKNLRSSGFVASSVNESSGAPVVKANSSESDNTLIGAASIDESSKLVSADIQIKYADRGVASFYAAKNPTLVIPKNEVDPGALLLAQMAAEEQKYAQLDKKEKENAAEKLWTSVGFAAGAFSSVNTGVSRLRLITQLPSVTAACQTSKRRPLGCHIQLV
jgi:hypothetical protein